MFYEVSPYYVLLEERHGSCPGMSRRVHAGFDVEIYGANVRNELAVRGPDPVYGLGCAELQKVSDKVSSHTSGSCLLEFIPAPSIVVIDTRSQAKVEATFRIRISHCRGLDQPAGPKEQHVLEEIENELHGLGITRR
jgi:hypothetical protein